MTVFFLHIPQQIVKNRFFQVNLKSLNPEQREAVVSHEGPVLVLAGAGTGKTRVITYRVAHMIENGIAPESILAVTFTNKAAREMKERVAVLVDESAAEALTVSTFHSFCASLLRKHIRRLGYTEHYDIAVDAYQTGLIRNLLTDLGLLTCGMTAPDISSLISRAKTRLLDPEDLRSAQGGADIAARRLRARSQRSFADASDDWPEWFPELYARYQRRLKSMNMVDFDDLLLLVARLWERNPDILEQHRQTYRYLMIDEYQDTNTLQLHLMKTLAAPDNNICVVGDDDQSIYGWRGATVENILEFEDDFPGAKIIRLEQNYRSTNAILATANKLIANNQSRHGKELWSEKGQGDNILVVESPDDREEAEFVADFLREKQMTRQGRFNDFAVLYRSNHQSRQLEQALKKHRIPYNIVGGKSFFQRKEVLDVISLLRVVNNPRDDQSLLRIINVPPRGVGEKSVERLLELHRITNIPMQELVRSDEYLKSIPNVAADNLRDFMLVIQEYRERFQSAPLFNSTRDLLARIGYLEGLIRMYKPREDAMRRRENVLEFLNAIAQFEQRGTGRTGLSEFLLEFALLDENDRNDNQDGRGEGQVSLMTVHSAKGLEFPLVVVVGMEYGLFPHRNSIDERGMDEERRLFYVAMTRAQEFLVLSHARQRMVNGTPEKRRKSPFLIEVQSELVDETDAASAFKPVGRETADDYLQQMRAMFEKK
jgi:DNA helicase-2/ATP-dependent DNA helicase PcrA